MRAGTPFHTHLPQNGEQEMKLHFAHKAKEGLGEGEGSEGGREQESGTRMDEGKQEDE
jgi:hypothetical protein